MPVPDLPSPSCEEQKDNPTRWTFSATVLAQISRWRLLPGEVEDFDGTGQQGMLCDVVDAHGRQEGEDEGKHRWQQPAKERVQNGPCRPAEHQDGRNDMVFEDEEGQQQEEEDDKQDAEQEVQKEDGGNDGEDLPESVEDVSHGEEHVLARCLSGSPLEIGSML